MVTVVPPKEEDKNNSVIMESSKPIKPEEIIIEREEKPGEAKARTQNDDPLSAMRTQMQEAEKNIALEREKRIAAEHDRDTERARADSAHTERAKSDVEKVAAQELAISEKFEAAKAKVENAERALEEAIDTGKSAKEQITLQKDLAEAVYSMKGAESAKAHFDNWKEKQKTAPARAQQDDGITPAAKKWINDHPRFNTDKKYKRVAVAAHEDAIEDGIKADSAEYFRRINSALIENGLEESEDPNPDATVQKKKPSSATSTGAPVTHNSTSEGARGGNAAGDEREGRKRFKLDGEMQQMALKTYGKGTSFNLPDAEAYQKYAARQIEIREKRKNGERI